MEITNQPITAESCVVRNTNSRKGRTRSIAPGATSARHLHYGRIILDAGDEPIRLSTAEHETSLICLKGGATVREALSSLASTILFTFRATRKSRSSLESKAVTSQKSPRQSPIVTLFNWCASPTCKAIRLSTSRLAVRLLSVR